MSMLLFSLETHIVLTLLISNDLRVSIFVMNGNKGAQDLNYDSYSYCGKITTTDDST